MSNQEQRDEQLRSGLSMKAAEVLVAVAILVFGLIVAFDSFRLGARWGTDGPQSGYFPFYIGVIIAIASLITLVTVLLNRSADGEMFVEWHALKPVMAVLIPAGFYVLGVQLIGIYVASAIYIAVFMVWLGGYSWFRSALVGIAVNASLYAMFEVWFKVPLFKGSYDLLGLAGL